MPNPSDRQRALLACLLDGLGFLAIVVVMLGCSVVLWGSGRFG